MNWGPYATQSQASAYLGDFADKAIGPGIGLIWSDGTACTLLRKPLYDADGFGDTLIVEWHGGLGPPKPTKPPTLLQRIGKLFEDAMTAYGESQIAEGQAQLAMGQEISDWFSNKDNEHTVGLIFDVIGVVSVVMLFVPGVGEVEMGLIAAARAGEVLLTAGRITAVAAGTGAAIGAYVDGKYLYLRHFDGEKAAKDWDESPQAVTMSLAAAILALPDFAVGGVMTLRDLRALPGELGESRKLAQGYEASAAAKAQKAERLQGRIPDEPAWKAKHLERKSSDIAARARKLAQKAAEANERAQRMQRKLYATMLLNAPSTFLGTPTAESYFIHDNASDLADPIRIAHRWIGSLLMPPDAHGTPEKTIHNFGMRIGVSNRSQSGAR
jgi:hypothetical protein